MQSSAGVVVAEGGYVAFVEPPELLSSGYLDFQVDESAYYARSTPIPLASNEREMHQQSKKRKRKNKRKVLNAKELNAEQRHLRARSLLLKAHEAFLSHCQAQERIKRLAARFNDQVTPRSQELPFVKLSELFQAPLYEVRFMSEDEPRAFPLFDSVVGNGLPREELVTCADSTYLLPRESKFAMSDFRHINMIIPATPTAGYNLILIDPPWENKSVHRRSLYPTLPNKYLLSLPLKRLMHSEGAIVALWVTNREKLRCFVEDELLPAWGLSLFGTWYWLKVCPGGQIVSDLDSTHHKPYECLLLAKPIDDSSGGMEVHAVPRDFVAISVPGEHSRKPPLGLLLAQFITEPRPLELFAREMYPGWTSWGNEAIRFQSTAFFSPRAQE